jgi:cytoskeletal protein CcmA (bactofilin family)
LKPNGRKSGKSRIGKQFMWKFGKEDERTPAPSVPLRPDGTRPAVAPKPVVLTSKEAYPVETPKPVQPYRADVAHIGKSVVIKGELSGSEDLYLDGEVEGSIELRGHSITVGPNGRVRANVHARDIIVQGRVDGDLKGGERVELKKSAVLVGNIFTQRIAIEDGAFFKGGIDIQKPEPKPEPKAEQRAEPKTTVSGTPSNLNNAAGTQGTFASAKK